MKNSMGLFVKVLGILCAFYSISFAEVFETQKMKDIENFIDPETLVLVDIDNTLMAPTGNTGSDPWFYFQWEALTQANPGAGQDNFIKALQIWTQAQDRIKMQPVEALTPGLIQKIRASGNTVIALTSRSPRIKDRTLLQLQSVGIELSPKLAGLDSSEAVSLPVGTHPELVEESLFMKGIVFVGNNDKGQVLRKLFGLANYKPQAVIYVDDKKPHVESVEKICEGFGIKYSGFRYGAADAKVNTYKARIAALLTWGISLFDALRIMEYADLF